MPDIPSDLSALLFADYDTTIARLQQAKALAEAFAASTDVTADTKAITYFSISEPARQRQAQLNAELTNLNDQISEAKTELEWVMQSAVRNVSAFIFDSFCVKRRLQLCSALMKKAFVQEELVRVAHDLENMPDEHTVKQAEQRIKQTEMAEDEIKRIDKVIAWLQTHKPTA